MIERELPTLPLILAGGACIIAGGLVAAATAPAPSTHGSWAAAYLVLVAGAAQVVLGLGQAVLAPVAPSRRVVTNEVVVWNTANAAVIAGTLLGLAALLYAGSALLVLGLGVFLHSTHSPGRPAPGLLWAYRLLTLLLLVSIPVGLVLEGTS